MAHSISHKLIIELNGSELTLITVKKDGLVANIEVYPFFDQPILEQILEKLPEIYTNITVLIRRKPFISVPENFYSANLSDIYKLSHEWPESEELYLDKSDNGIGIAYFLDPTFVSLVTAKFQRVTFQHEASVILKKLYKEVNFKQPRILFSINNETLIIFAINNAQLVLCNTYQAKTNDDVFYFVMLIFEQLHFLPGETELVILGEPPNRTELFDLFKNYIKDINLWIENYTISEDIKQPHLLAHTFAVQAMLCE